MQVLVKTLTDDILPVDVEPTDLVETLKAKILISEGTPILDQAILFDSHVLEDRRLLSDYNIQHLSVLNLLLERLSRVQQERLAEKYVVRKMICKKCYGRLPARATRCRKAKCGRTTEANSMQVLVKTLTDEILPVDVEPTDLVETLKAKILISEGIPIFDQAILLDSHVLEDRRQLCEYNIQHLSVLNLLLHASREQHRALAEKYLIRKMICKKCYGRLPAGATRCRKAKCGRTTDVRKKKALYGQWR